MQKIHLGIRVVFLALVVALGGLWSNASHAATCAEELFAKHFKEHYAPRYCFQNAMTFLGALEKQTGNVDDYALVAVDNRGLSVFGMVNAEKVRGQLRGKPATEEKNWFHHVFVVGRDGMVYDFDFDIEPKVIPLEQYIEEMYLDEPECHTKGTGKFCGGREEKLKSYEWTVTTGQDALDKDDSRERKVTMGEVLKDPQILFP